MIQTAYTISETEFAEAQQIWCTLALKKLPGRWLVLGVSLLMGGFIGWSFQYLPFWLVCALGGSLLAFLFISQWRKKAIRHYQYTTNAEQWSDIEVWIDESGYRDEKLGRCGGWTAWTAFTGWREGTNVFILGRNLFFIPVPKSALTLEQQQELRTMLTARFGATV
jgi:hypothetical protein